MEDQNLKVYVFIDSINSDKTPNITGWKAGPNHDRTSPVYKEVTVEPLSLPQSILSVSLVSLESLFLFLEPRELLVKITLKNYKHYKKVLETKHKEINTNLLNTNLTFQYFINTTPQQRVYQQPKISKSAILY